MSAAKHTPGPWSVTGMAVYAGTITGTSADEALLEVTSTYGSSFSADEARATARLIAAAPDLAACLYRVLGVLQNGDFPASHLMADARDALRIAGVQA